jgi:hypothetical protein
MCTTIYQTYSHCDCFLVKITYCELSQQITEAPCPQEKKKTITFPLRCGLEECPRFIASLKFDEGENGDRRGCGSKALQNIA